MNKEECIEWIQGSLDSHISWANYYKRGGEPTAWVGELEFHEECIVKYTQVIQYIRENCG